MNTGGVVGGNRSQDESPVVWLVGGLVQCLGRGKSVACYLRHQLFTIILETSRVEDRRWSSFQFFVNNMNYESHLHIKSTELFFWNHELLMFHPRSVEATV